MTDPLAMQLATPLGLPGSGRLRYGAAMALYGQDRISAAVLEAYRVASALDGQDPAAILAAEGLALPGLPAPDAVAAIRGLVDEADIYLSTLPGPGVAEVRAGISAARDGAVTPGGRASAVVDRHLAPALAGLALTHPALAAAIAGAAPHLDWITYDSYPRDQIGEAFAQGHAFASLVGGGAPIPAEGFDFGLFLIAPHVLYRDHNHAAPELYAPLTGPHGWRFGPGTPLVVKPAHQPVWNDPYRPHCTKVGAVPFLCLFGWTRDVNEPARVLPAPDWPELEALRLD
jgi:hypothetical protein